MARLAKIRQERKQAAAFRKAEAEVVDIPIYGSHPSISCSPHDLHQPSQEAQNLASTMSTDPSENNHPNKNEDKDEDNTKEDENENDRPQEDDKETGGR
ncbi:hypothetical protein H4Q26_000768 [Puccinia striiformis f. sp. tritici PST-130]|nr:hypothetical protein H4Q26_000768 [Puccinia striiformis f. sp. tritici PST-130]